MGIELAGPGRFLFRPWMGSVAAIAAASAQHLACPPASWRSTFGLGSATKASPSRIPTLSWAKTPLTCSESSWVDDVMRRGQLEDCQDPLHQDGHGHVWWQDAPFGANNPSRLLGPQLAPCGCAGLGGWTRRAASTGSGAPLPLGDPDRMPLDHGRVTASPASSPGHEIPTRMRYLPGERSPQTGGIYTAAHSPTASPSEAALRVRSGEHRVRRLRSPPFPLHALLL